jgi:hypothetical protein
MSRARVDVCDAAEDAILINLPATVAVAERSRSVPVVVDVSIEVEDSLASDPPAAMTLVVCGIRSAVPVVKALAVITWTGPVAVPEFRLSNPALFEEV